MSAPSSTSSSDTAVAAAADPATRSEPSAHTRLGSVLGARAVLLALLIAAAFIAVIELRLHARGFRPTVLDSPELWSRWRREANVLGKDALVFVGASRLQLGIDPATVARTTGLAPVQLAIDASMPLPVLEHLAHDPGFHGQVIMDFYPAAVTAADREDDARRYVRHHDAQRPPGRLPTFDRTEPWLRERVRWSLASYADGAAPWQSLLLRVLSPATTPAYLVTWPDRSREADYRLVPMPDFALSRALRHLESGPWDYDGPRQVRSVAALDAAVASIRSPTETPADFLQGVERIVSLARRLHQRGASLTVVQMPTSGYVQEIDRRRYPRALFWDVLATRLREVSVVALHSADVPALLPFVCPDGSHLDRSDRAAFTAALMQALGLARPAEGGVTASSL